jgi:phosphatidylglycerol:prolipoprotein diacylglycerol transferase
MPTPIFEFIVALALAWVLWRLAGKPRPLGWLTGVYLILTGTARFIVEFWRINPLIYFHKHLSNAQVASLGSVLVGIAIVIAVRRHEPVGGPAPMPESIAV